MVAREARTENERGGKSIHRPSKWNSPKKLFHTRLFISKFAIQAARNIVAFPFVSLSSLHLFGNDYTVALLSSPRGEQLDPNLVLHELLLLFHERE